MIRDFLVQYRIYHTAILALFAIGVEIYYIVCHEACAYLRGELFGIPLEYVGIGYMVLIILLALAKKAFFLFLSLSVGVGIEFYLIGFQIWHSVYCIYCLTFGGLLILMFLVNFEQRWKRLSILSGIVGLILFAIFFKGTATFSYANEILIPEFGSGPVKVRLYTDYFCPPCRSMESKIEPILEELFEKNKITITFIDTPSTGVSTMYARYFLYILNERKDFNRALLARSALVGAAFKKIRERDKLEEYLREKGIKFQFFDPKATFDVLNGHLKTDKINSTPTCVIIKNDEVKKYTGINDILDALKRLKE
ncbi:MAG: thioredoxin domain-containing protein [Syntrophorhabdaceae bacterium]|nr:thioredoxin domain-containing protein [Syntrophorhabdaceae bacterium]